ncbi:MAG: class C beta-lactamase-related serine hydrolase [Gemmatimonadales bacterium]|nr:MAG: class C beta-lactamase-related serine hydrolase [Gemmatimonadales bacterium]
MITTLLVVALAGTAPPPVAADTLHVPPPGAWETRAPEALGMDPDALEAAISFALEAESTTPRDLAVAHLRGFGREPLGDAVGPFRERGDPSGIIVKNGYIVAEWGDPHRVDNTFSVTKSFLSAVVGLAHHRGLIPDIHEPVERLMAPVQVEDPRCVAPGPPTRDFDGPADPFIPFAGDHAGAITWDHLLRQTSDWAGTLWCKPDWADRPAGDADTWGARDRHEPGTRYEYNDVRVNLLALAALNVWRRPLPEVLREHLMDPIGASPTWRWTGYDTSWILLDGQWVQSVSGGAHWGGGMFISARDMARFGLLHLRKGQWGDREVLPESWIDKGLEPGEANPGYGFMNHFLNVDGRNLSSATPGSHYHAGAGSNIVYVDPEHDLVVVVRWIRQQALDEFIGRVLASIPD